MLSYLKDRYWDFSKKKGIKAKLSLPENRIFADHINSERQQTMSLAEEGISDEIHERLEAAIKWLLFAQQVTADDGVSLGYFPLSSQGDWMPSYPETTGYIITTLLRYAQGI